MIVVDLRGASAGFSHRERLLLSQRALSVSGVALTGLGSRSRRHVSCARAERRLLGTPRVTTCTASGVSGPAATSRRSHRLPSPAGIARPRSASARRLALRCLAVAPAGLVGVAGALLPRLRALRRQGLADGLAERLGVPVGDDLAGGRSPFLRALRRGGLQAGLPVALGTSGRGALQAGFSASLRPLGRRCPSRCL